MTVPTLTDLLYIKKGFLSKEKCDIIINEYESSNHKYTEEYEDSLTGCFKESTYTVVSSLIGSEAFNLIHSTTETMVNQYHDYLESFGAFHKGRRSALMHPHNYRILKYEKGASIQPHVDYRPGIHASCTINLNDEYTGGDFCFWNGKHRLKLGRGDVIIFPTDYFWVHEVEKIESGVRYSTNTFLCEIPMQLPRNIKFNIKNLDQDTSKSSKPFLTYG